jgi:hypothetical protein
MKPDWDKLMDAYAGSATQLVGDVDCTAAGEPLCQKMGVQGYPTIKWGDPSALEDYEGGRDYESLNTFVEENLKPMCSPANIDLCDDAKKAEIEKFQGMSESDLDSFIKDKETEQEKLEKDFESFIEGLQQQYEVAMAENEKAMEEVKNSGLGLAKAVNALKSSKDKDEL